MMLSVRNLKAARTSLRASLSSQAAAAQQQGEIVSFLTLNNLADNPGAVKKVC